MSNEQELQRARSLLSLAAELLSSNAEANSIAVRAAQLESPLNRTRDQINRNEHRNYSSSSQPSAQSSDSFIAMNTSQRTGPSPSQATSSDNYANRTSRTVAEMRRLWSPYDVNRARSAGRPAISTPEKPWHHRFFCLGGPEDKMTPTSYQKVAYQAEGLGDKLITSVRTASSHRLTMDIRSHFPRLGDCNFELLRSSGGAGGGHGKLLCPISEAEEIPSVSVIVASRVGLIYIRPHLPISEDCIETTPTENIVPNDVLESRAPPEMTENVSLGSSVTPVSAISTEVRASTEHSSLGMPVHVSEDGSGGGTSELTGLVSHGGFHFVPPEFAVRTAYLDTNDRTLEMYGIHEEFRAQIYMENPGVQAIVVQRDEFVDQVLGMYMKDVNLDLKKKPYVQFVGEAGRDLGGLTKEFFGKALLGIVTEKFRGRFMIFEGQDEFKVPSLDSGLLRSGVFKAVGLLMAHSYIHTGVLAIGLSPAVAQYLSTASTDIETHVNVCFDDITSFETREVVTILNEWVVDGPLDEELRVKVSEQAIIAGFSDELTFDNRHLLKEVVMLHNVINIRKAQLDDIKQAFRTSGIFSFLTSRTDIIQNACRKQRNSYTSSIILNHIDFDNEEIKSWFSDFLVELEQENDDKISCLLQCWTSSPFLSTDRLRVNVGDVDFCIHTCFNTIDVLSNFSKEDVIMYLRMAMDHGGFGSI